jgi:hypothetical protein
MKTKLFLFAALIISTITFSQTSKKGYDYYKAVTNSSKMNKGELVDAIAKDAGNFEKRVARTGRNPQTGKKIKSASQTKDLRIRKRPGRIKNNNFNVKQEYGPTIGKNLRKRPGGTKATDYNSSRSNKNSNH